MQDKKAILDKITKEHNDLEAKLLKLTNFTQSNDPKTSINTYSSPSSNGLLSDSVSLMQTILIWKFLSMF